MIRWVESYPSPAVDHPDSGALNVTSEDGDVDRRLVERYWHPFMTEPTETLISNARTTCRLLDHHGILLPVTVNQRHDNNTYVCSPYTTYITYAKEELYLLAPWLRTLLKLGITALQPLLHVGKIDRVVHVNNWLLSTCLYPQTELDFAGIVDYLTRQYENHAIVFRSLNEGLSQTHLARLKQLGFLLVPSRQIYWLDPSWATSDLFKLPDLVKDRKLRNQTKYSVSTTFSEVDDERICELYKMLYIDKYSACNPQYTTSYIRAMRTQGTMNWIGFRDSEGRLDAIAGRYERAGVVTTPLVGYDLTLPQSLGLYRLLMGVTLDVCFREQKIIHLSSGAARFKRLRGARPAIEYSAVWIHHLPARQQSAWRMIQHLADRYVKPMMVRKKL